jgi:hypothetical protein
MGKSTISMAMLNSFLYGLEGSMKQQSIRQVQGIQPTISSFIYPHYIPIHIFISHKKNTISVGEIMSNHKSQLLLVKSPFLFAKSLFVQCKIHHFCWRNPHVRWRNHHFLPGAIWLFTIAMENPS